MGYATTDDVLARAGRVQGSLQVAGRRPNLADAQKFLDDTAAEIDAAIEARGFDPAGLEQATRDAFRDLNAYGALLRVMSAMSDAPANLMAEARSVWEGAMGTPSDPRGSISLGTFPAIVVLEAGKGGGGPGAGAGSLWTEEPTYGGPDSVRAEAEALRNSNLAPAFSRGQKL